MTPGVYTVEKSAFPPSVVGAPTAIPAFIGYTEKAARNGKSLHNQPLLIQSLDEYHKYFGGAPETKYPIVEVTGIGAAPPAPGTYDFTYGPKYYAVRKATELNFLLYNCLRLYFQNQGGQCYIVSVGTYLAYDPITKGDAPSVVSKPDLVAGLDTLPLVPFPKPTMLLMPDLMVLDDKQDAYAVQVDMLQQCGDLMDRMAIMDIWGGDQGLESGVIEAFRNNIGVSNMNYGAAYYPWLECDVIDVTDITYDNVDNSGKSLPDGSTPVKMTDLFKGNPVISTLDVLTTDLTTLQEYILVPTQDYKDFHTWEDAFNSGQGDAAAVLKTQGTVIADMYQVLFDLGNGGKSGGDPNLKISNSNLISAIKLLTNPKGGLAGLMLTLAGYDAHVGKKGAGAGIGGKLKKWGITGTPKNPFGTTTDADVEFNMAEPFYKAAYAKLFKALNMATGTAVTLMTSYNTAMENSNAAYKNIMKAVAKHANILPPASAMAGVISHVDNSSGVWNAPANLNIAGVVSPMVSINDAQQAPLNVDALAGKSINAIRSFYGRGPAIIWGARTLDGNSNDWRYINVRRTLIYIEQSVKNAAFNVVFAPNDHSTWNTVNGMISNFLRGLWNSGGLQGASPADAFSVEVGLGKTMSAEDILNGIMRVTVKVAVVHPAEFIIITYEQQMAKS